MDKTLNLWYKTPMSTAIFAVVEAVVVAVLSVVDAVAIAISSIFDIGKSR